MSVRFWLVRHGPTHSKDVIGWTDIPADLSDTEQVKRTARFVPEGAIVVSSDLIRAVDTASAIAFGRSRLPHNPDLREFNFGDWEGRSFTDIAEADAAASRAFWETPGDVAAPGGESFHGVQDRVVKLLYDLAEAHGSGDICCVAHFGVILAALAHAADVPAQAALRFHIDNLSVTRLTYLPDAKAWSIGAVNHLP